jgi:dihydrofolate reductase
MDGMRKVVYGGAVSLDNYLARKDHRVDWLRWSKEAAEVMAAIWPTFDTVIMGRKTYEFAAQHGQAGGYPGVANYVFSRTLTSAPAGNVQIIRDDAADFVRELKRQEGKDICLMGGGELARSLFEASLIDEVGLNIHPILLGDGIPALPPMGREISLERIDCRAFANGCVYVRYRVIGTVK